MRSRVFWKIVFLGIISQTLGTAIAQSSIEQEATGEAEVSGLSAAATGPEAPIDYESIGWHAR